MYKLHLIVLLLIVGTVTLTAQQSDVEALRQKLAVAETDTAKINTFILLAKALYPSDQEVAKTYAHQAKELASKNNLPIDEAKAINLIGICQFIQSDYQAALTSHYSALNIRERLADTLGIAESFINIGNVTYRSKKLDEAAEIYKKALKYAKLANSERGLAIIYNNLGQYYEEKWYANKDSANYCAALDYTNQSIAIKRQLNDNVGLATNLRMLGSLHASVGEPDKGLPYWLEAQKIIKEAGHNEGLATTTAGLAELYQQLGESKKAEKLADEAYALALEMNSYYTISYTAGIIADIAHANHDYRKAFDYLRIHKEYGDSIYNESTQKIRDDLAVRYETDKKELQNQVLLGREKEQQATIANKNKVLWLSACCSVFLVIVLAYVFLARRKLTRINRELTTKNEVIRSKNRMIRRQTKEIQHQAHLLRQKNEELEKANDFHEKIFSLISHDLHAPLSSLKMALEMHGNEAFGKNDPVALMRMLSQEVDIAFNLLHNLLHWAKSQMNNNQVNWGPVDMHELIDNIVSQVSGPAFEKRIQIQHDLSETFIVNTDKDRISFVIRNVLTNAVKFTECGGRIDITVRDGVDDVVISIQDNGVGMASHLQDLLRSMTIHTTMGTAQERGSGMGLVLSKDLLNSFAGKLEMKSQIGLGTTVEIILPKTAQSETFNSKSLENFTVPDSHS